MLCTHRCLSLVGLTASCFGLGATFSNFFGQLVVEKLGHMESLMGSLGISIIPVLLFGLFMPETMGQRGSYNKPQTPKQETNQYVEMP